MSNFKMMISTKAYIKKPDRRGLSKIYIRYSAGCSTDTVSLDMMIHFSEFDTLTGFVKAVSRERLQVNQAISRESALLRTITAAMSDDDFKDIKKVYLNLKAILRLQGSGSVRTSAGMVLTQNEDTGKYRANVKNQLKIEALQKQLRQLLKQQIEFKAARPGDITLASTDAVLPA